MLTSYYYPSRSDTRTTQERLPPGHLIDLKDWRFASVADLAVPLVDWRTAGVAVQVAVSGLPTMRPVESRECQTEPQDQDGSAHLVLTLTAGTPAGPSSIANTRKMPSLSLAS